jgi:hypothetical protein
MFGKRQVMFQIDEKTYNEVVQEMARLKAENERLNGGEAIQVLLSELTVKNQILKKKDEFISALQKQNEKTEWDLKKALSTQSLLANKLKEMFAIMEKVEGKMFAKQHDIILRKADFGLDIIG